MLSERYFVSFVPRKCFAQQLKQFVFFPGYLRIVDSIGQLRFSSTNQHPPKNDYFYNYIYNYNYNCNSNKCQSKTTAFPWGKNTQLYK